MNKDSQEHLNDVVNETYLQHMRIAFNIGFTRLVTGFFCLIKKTSSNQIAKIYEMLS